VYKLEYKFRFRGLWRKFHDTNLAVGLVVTGFDVKSTTAKKSPHFLINVFFCTKIQNLIKGFVVGVILALAFVFEDA
jgi:hypothetical protein